VRRDVLAGYPDVAVAGPVPVSRLPYHGIGADGWPGNCLGHWRRDGRRRTVCADRAAGQGPCGAEYAGGDGAVFHFSWKLPGSFVRADTCALAGQISIPAGFGQMGSRMVATACAAMPSPRPVKPSFSVVVALTEILDTSTAR